MNLSRIEESPNDRKIGHCPGHYSISIARASELELRFTMDMSCFCKWIWLVADVSTIEGGLPLLAANLFSCNAN
jgi:hypothetical protein